MVYLLSEWDKLRNGLKDKHILFFLDYDGTLTPIKRKPAEAVISKGARRVLRQLSEGRRNKVAIVSGRSLKDVKKMVGLPGLVYVGNHGLEIRGPGINFKCPVSPAYAGLVRKIKKELAGNVSKIQGTLIEDKGLTLSVHFRRVKKSDEVLVKDVFHGIIRPYLEKKMLRVTFGKKVFEIRPPLRWDKGKAVLWLLARCRHSAKKSALPIYLGDDVTDEDAFRALKKIGITVFVGKAPLSEAKYYLNNSREVVKFLKAVLSLQDERKWQS